MLLQHRATHIGISAVDSIQAKVRPENLVSLVIPVDCRGSAEIDQWERDVDKLRHVKRDTKDLRTTSKQDEILQRCRDKASGKGRHTHSLIGNGHHGKKYTLLTFTMLSVHGQSDACGARTRVPLFVNGTE